MRVMSFLLNKDPHEVAHAHIQTLGCFPYRRRLSFECQDSGVLDHCKLPSSLFHNRISSCNRTLLQVLRLFPNTHRLL